MASANRIGLALATFVVLAGTSAAQVPVQDIQIFNPMIPVTSTNRGDEGLAIDGNSSSFSYLTPSFTSGPRYAGLDLGGLLDVNRIQVNKMFANVDGVGTAVDPMDLQILYTTDLGPINQRNYVPVLGLTNGYLGSEMITANSVNSGDATVIYDTHEGVYSLSFNTVATTGLAFRFDRNADHDFPNTHYPTAEFTPMNGVTAHTVTAIDIFRAAIPAGTIDLNRGDQAIAIDGNLETFSYLTASGTQIPAMAALDLGSVNSVERLRVAKFSNQVTGVGIVEPMNLQLLYTTDTGPLNERTYQPVSGLTNGFNGTELINATLVDSGSAMVLDDIHEYPTDGYFSLSFNAVNATAIAFAFSKPDGSANAFVHYPVMEFEVYGSGAPLVPGDFDGDGDVDGADFVAWQTHFPTSSGATLADGDGDADGDVDGADFVVWQTNFPFTPGPGVTPVPEPGAIILTMLGGVITLARSRIRK